jgi:hypothetical protein
MAILTNGMTEALNANKQRRKWLFGRTSGDNATVMASKADRQFKINSNLEIDKIYASLEASTHSAAYMTTVSVNRAHLTKVKNWLKRKGYLFATSSTPLPGEKFYTNIAIMYLNKSKRLFKPDAMGALSMFTATFIAECAVHGLDKFEGAGSITTYLSMNDMTPLVDCCVGTCEHAAYLFNEKENAKFVMQWRVKSMVTEQRAKKIIKDQLQMDQKEVDDIFKQFKKKPKKDQAAEGNARLAKVIDMIGDKAA